MLFVKILGCIMVIASSTAMGFIYSEQFKKRKDQLSDLIFIIRVLGNELILSKTLAYDLLNNLSKKSLTTEMGLVFSEAARLVKDKRYGADKAVFEAFKNKKGNIHLKNKDIDVAVLIGQALTTLGEDQEKRILENIESSLKELEKEAVDECTKNVKTFKSIGILAGIAIVIVLI